MEKDFSLDLKQGPYFHSYSRNGRDLLLGGQRGHVALFDWHKPRIKTELQLEERINDVCTLFDDSLFAVAQKKHLYMYDNNGIEIHCIRKHKFVHKLTYLPYHFLLCSIGKFGILKYIDISTGEDVSALNTKSGPCGVMQQNPWNAVIHLGHLNGSVTLWSPKTQKPLAKMLCHKAPVTSVNIDMLGRYLVTSGADNKIKVWDLRKFGLLHGHHKKVSKPNCVALSQKNMLAVAEGPRVSVYENIVVKKLDNQVKRALFPGHRITSVSFCPFEDALGLSKSEGFSTLMVPRSGEADFDSLEINPFETKGEKKNRLVRSLLDKVQPELITLNPNDIGKILN